MTVDPGQEVGDLGPGQRHQSSLTEITPAERGASCSNSRGLRSMTQPWTYGPAITDRALHGLALAVLVTVTTVPNGSDLWAQIPASWSYQDALPLSVLPAAGAGRGAAVVVVVGRASAGRWSWSSAAA
jgi:hypothetical protein